MDLSAMKDLYIGSTPVQSAWLGGTKVWERTPAVDIQAIKDAMLLWYDLKRQGATNESMAATPELANLAYDPDKSHVIDWTQFSTRGDGVQQFSIEITSTTNYWVINQGAYHRTNSIPSFYVEVANLPEGKVINYFYGNGSDERQTYAITYNGLHKLPACKISPNVTTASGFFISNENGQTVADVVGTTITQVNPSLNATCYNFAWSGMSGIGGTNAPFVYNQDEAFTEVNFSDGGLKLICNGQFTGGYKVVGSGEISSSSLIDINPIKVTNLVPSDDANYQLTWQYRLHLSDGSWTEVTMMIKNDGVYTIDYKSISIPEGLTIVGVEPYRFYFGNNPFEVNNLTIEQQPLYPNALVADGVDDYCRVNGLPLLTDYTVIVKRDFINTDANGVTAVKGQSASGGKNQAFSIDIFNYNAETYYGAFGNTVTVSQDIINAGIVEATPNRINDRVVSTSGSNDIWPYLHLCGYPVTDRYNNIALYSFILFNRTLTEEEINWVKTNLIEGDTEL